MSVYVSFLLVCVSAGGIFAGCGGDTESSSQTAKINSQPASEASSQTAFTSPALKSGDTIPKSFRCTANIWLPLNWGPVPDNTAEIALNVQAFGQPQRENGRVVWTPVVAGSLITGLRPTFHALHVGKVPTGAVEREEENIPACPERSRHEKYVFRLFAIPRGNALSQISAQSESAFDMLNRLVSEGRTIGEFLATRD
jgi:phosphatidylethanolamine-binding protein (PEBP) family uncharacterized protein